MKVRKITVGLLGAMIALGSANVLGAWANADITDIRAFSDQDVHYVQVTAFSNPDGCSQPSYLVLLRDDASNWKMVHTLLLTGFISGKNVDVRTSGCHVTGYTIIDGAKLLK